MRSGHLDVACAWRFRRVAWRGGETRGAVGHRMAIVRHLPQHWREYAIEAACLSLFMVSAAGFATLLRHPASPLSSWDAPAIVHRIPMGIAMGLTAIALIYSPLGQRSGAHMNPSVTLTYFRLGKV